MLFSQALIKARLVIVAAIAVVVTALVVTVVTRRLDWCIYCGRCGTGGWSVRLSWSLGLRGNVGGCGGGCGHTVVGVVTACPARPSTARRRAVVPFLACGEALPARSPCEG